jgi:uncharacterized protein (DUF2132 family)
MSENIDKIKFICESLEIGIKRDETFDSMLNKLHLKMIEKEERYQEKLKREILEEEELKKLVEKYGDDDLEMTISTRVYHEFENSHKFLDYMNRKAEKEYLEKLREVKELVEKYGNDNMKLHVSMRVHQEFENSRKIRENLDYKVQEEYLKELRKIRDEQELKRKCENNEGDDNAKKFKVELESDSDFNFDSDE